MKGTAHAFSTPGSVSALQATLSSVAATRFASGVDEAITDALRQFGLILGADRGQIIRFGPAACSAFVTHSWAVGGVSTVPPKAIGEQYPWIMRRLRDQAPVVLARVGDLPADAHIDGASFRQTGAKSHLSMPMAAGGRLEGAIAFDTVQRERAWPDELVAWCRVLATVLANALAHKHTQEALDESIRFEHLVSDTLAGLLTAGRAEQGRVVEAGLGQMARMFGAERATLWQRVGDRGEFIMTQRWLAEGVPKPPDVTGSVTLPWIAAQLLAGRAVHFARLDDLPAGASTDEQTLQSLGIRSAMIVALRLSGRVVGALSFASARDERTWPEALIPRVTLLGEVLASTLARQAAEEREHEAQAQAAHAARVGTMGMFAASLVHELTQPLAASLANAETMTELLAAPSFDREELCSIAADIVADDRRVGGLIQQLHRFLRRGEPEWSECEFRNIVDDTVRLVAKDAAENGITLTVDIPDGLPKLVGDPLQLQQVMLNLLLNAVDAVSAKAHGERRVAMRVQATGSGISAEVSDSGQGMDEATMARVFQPFFTTKPKGMGLGLSISHSIVAAHGGRLTVRSTLGQGTAFRLELPSPPRGAAQPERPALPRASVTGTVYVIDDDASMRRALERQLRGAGHRVEGFPSAQHFLQCALQPGIRCIVSDVRMPGITGLDLQASLRKASPDLPLVFISGYGDVATTVRALKSGAIDFLTKPFTRQQLLAAIAEALSRSRDTIDNHARINEVKRRHRSLTSREMEVFSLVASGLRNKVIAQRLGGAEATIKIHRGRVMKKMEAASSADLVRMAEALRVMTGDSASPS